MNESGYFWKIKLDQFLSIRMNCILMLIDFESPAYTTGSSPLTSFKIIAHLPEIKEEIQKLVNKCLNLCVCQITVLWHVKHRMNIWQMLIRYSVLILLLLQDVINSCIINKTDPWIHDYQCESNINPQNR